jgi:hypothetical protein
MPAGLPVAFLLLAQAAGTSPNYGPAPPVAPTPAPPPAKPGERVCLEQNKDPKANEIVICAPKPQGYRIDPDVLEARREKKQGPGSRPHSPHETYADHSCANVGPMGCRGVPTINVLAAALVAAKMADRLSKGQEVGSMFETTPTSGEYRLYVDAKKRREEKEADVAAAKAKAAAEAARPTKASQ